MEYKNPAYNRVNRRKTLSIDPVCAEIELQWRKMEIECLLHELD